jgi:siroheme synthase-like protein
MKKNYLPIAINIADQKILLIGGGIDAYKKLQILQRYGADVEVLASEVCDEIKKTGINFITSEYHKKYLKNYLMVYSCLDDDHMDQQIVKDCNEARVLVNIHDKPDLCQFVSPAIYRKGKISVAVSSNGENVYESIRIRNIIRDNIELN